VRVEPTTDICLIKEVIGSVYDEVTEDGDPEFEDYTPSVEGRLYLAGYVNGDVIGIVVYCYHADRTMIHIMVRPEFRARYAGVLARKALRERQGTIFTEIPDLYPNVIEFAKRFGFKVIDRSDTCFKKGVEYVQNTLRLD
jgi:hypothetical protein